MLNAQISRSNAQVEAMLESWQPEFQQLGWKDRLSLLEQIDEYVQIRASRETTSLSQTFTSELIDRLKAETVDCREQVYIYLNSKSDMHRQIARVWLTVRDPENPIVMSAPLKKNSKESEKRVAVRHAVELPSVVVANDHDVTGTLKDVSFSGARITLNSVQRLGSSVMLHLPLLRPIAASVVWVASSSIGVAFVSHQGALLHSL